MLNDSVYKREGCIVDLEGQTENIPYIRTLPFLRRSGKSSQVRRSDEVAFTSASVSLTSSICKEQMRTYFFFFCNFRPLHTEPRAHAPQQEKPPQ